MSITAPPARRHHGVPFGFVILLIASCLGTLAGELIKQEDVKKRIVMIIGENEYHTWETLPEFALKELEWRGYEVLYVQASPKDGDADFKNIEALRGADLVVISARRRTPPKAMMDLLRAHVAAGKPIVGIRTASHAFAAEPARADLAAWESFDTDVLGAHYEGHYNNKPPAGIQSVIETVAANASHPVLTGVKSTPFQVTSSLYKSRHPAHGTLILLEGHVDGGGTVEPVAWVNNAHNRRVFYTSLGNPDDFQLPAFRRLLLNGMLWCLHDPLPPASADIGQAASSAGPKAPAPAPVPGSAPAPVLPSVPPVADLPQDANGPALSPVEAQTRFHVADDLTWEQVLAEPQITQPVFLNFDARGRMWVVEYRQYPSPAGLKMISHDSVWRSVYDRVPPPPPHHFKGADRISIHSDTDGDGTFDQHKTFLDGLNIVTSLEHGRGGIWVLNPPYLLFYADANNDDVPDHDPEVRLAGFGLEDTHSVANSLRWGPDGWLYGAQGSTVTANISITGTDGKPKNAKPIFSQGQNIWRYHPERRIYEIFSEGGGNAFGCEIDSKGRIFSGHNGGDTRGFHYLQGAFLQKGFEKHGPLSNPYAFGYFPAMPHDAVARFTHNFIIYDHGALPARYDGKLLGIEPLQGRIVESEIVARQSSFHTHDVARPVTSDDRWFRPVDIKVGPDGAVYVCDWYDQQINHFRNHEGKIDTSNGRIYRLRSKNRPAKNPEDLTKYSGTQLMEQLSNPNRWIRQTVQRLLADHPQTALHPVLCDKLHSSSGQIALESLWVLHQTGGLAEPEILKALDHADPFVRLWTARLAADLPPVAPAITAKLASLATTEKNLEVRNQLAATAKRLPAREGLSVVKALAQRTEDVADNRMPLLLWWAIEAQCNDHPDEVLQLFADAHFWKTPLVETHFIERLARRFALAGSRRDLLACAKLFQLSPSPGHSRRLMTGFETAFKGRTLAGLPDALVTAMARHDTGSAAFAVRQESPGAIRRAILVVQDKTASRAERLEYLGVLSEVRIPEALPALVKACMGEVNDDGLQKAILTAFQNYDDPAIAEVVLNVYAALGRESLPVAWTLLASRPAWSFILARAIHSKASNPAGVGIKPETIPLNIIRKLKQHRDPELLALLEKIWPNTGKPTTEEMEKKIHHLAGVIRSGHGDPYQGRTLFQNACSTCHRLFNQGGQIGPDLTVHDRTDLESMLLATVNPNAEIREGFENYSVETRDGRSLTGFLMEQDEHTIVLRGLDNQNVTLPRQDLTELKPAGISLMPEGLLDALTEQQTRDLFAYLRSTQPLVGEAPLR